MDVPPNALVAVYGAADINPCVSHLVGSADAVVWSGAQRVGYLRSYRLNRTGGYETLYSSGEHDYTIGSSGRHVLEYLPGGPGHAHLHNEV